MDLRENIMNVIPFYCGLALFFWGVLFISFTRDRSRYRNCYFLFLSILSTIAAISFLAGEYQVQVLLLVFFVVSFALLIVPFFLIHNGIVMLRKEGRSLANLLSLGFGIVIAIGEIATFLAVLLPAFSWPDPESAGQLPVIAIVSIFISISVIYISLTFLAFMLYSVFLQIIPRKKDFDYVIIHGAGLLDGERVSKLLSERIDKAIEVYQKDPTPPVLIPSGGKGSDEKLSEAEAMAGYLLGKGIPPEKIIREDKSTTTYENLKFSKEIIEAQEGDKYTALVTSNYHVYRALRYCRKIGLKCTGIGSHVAFYYWPSALIREYIAIHAEKKHLIYLIAGWVLFMLPACFVFLEFI